MAKPTYLVVCAARTMLSHGIEMEKVLASLPNHHTQAEIGDAIAELRRRVNKSRNASTVPSTSWRGIVKFTPVEIPAHVIADRERRLLLVPTSTTAALMGDPPPNYRVADVAPSITPSIYRDPLDALVFKRCKTGARYG